MSETRLRGESWWIETMPMVPEVVRVMRDLACVGSEEAERVVIGVINEHNPEALETAGEAFWRDVLKP